MLIRDSFRVYREEFGKIMLLGLLIILPVYFLCTLINNYFYTYYGIMGLFFIGEFFSSINIIIATAFLQLPFIRLIIGYKKGEYIPFSQLFGDVLKYGFVVFIMSILYGMAIGVGLFLFIIPGFIIMILFHAFPYSVVIEEKKWWNAFKSALEFGKKNFWKLTLIIFGFTLIQLAFEWGVQLLIFLFTKSYLAILIAIGITNILFLPLFTLINALLFSDWKDQFYPETTNYSNQNYQTPYYQNPHYQVPNYQTPNYSRNENFR